jgi:hypothetical protein
MFERAARWILVAILAVLTWRFARAPLDDSAMAAFLHLPDLVFHEAGHTTVRTTGSPRPSVRGFGAVVWAAVIVVRERDS